MGTFVFKNAICCSHGNKRIVVYKDYSEKECGHRGTIVCVHALGRNASDFDYLANFFSNLYRVICIDLSGHGYSDYMNNWQLYSHDFFLEDVLSVINNERLQEIKYLGSSLGGIIGITLASFQNTQISSLILNDIGPITEKTKISTAVHLSQDLLRERFVFKTYEESKHKLLRSLAGYNFNVDSQEKMDYLIDNSIVKSNDGLYRMRFDPAVLKVVDNSDNKMRKEGLWKEWNNILCPSMLIYGAKSNLMSEKIVERMKIGKTNFFSAKCIQSGHVCSLSNNEQLNLINDWMSGILKNCTEAEIGF